MSDTTPRNPTGAPQMLADALLRSVAGTSAMLRVTGINHGYESVRNGPDGRPTFADVVVSPVVMRKQRPTWQEGGESKWELLVSATGVQQQVDALDLASAQALFAMTLAVTVAGQDYLIESVASNEVSARCIYTGCYCARRGSRRYEDRTTNRMGDSKDNLIAVFCRHFRKEIRRQGRDIREAVLFPDP